MHERDPTRDALAPLIIQKRSKSTMIHHRIMARMKQTTRKCTGGKAHRKQLATKVSLCFLLFLYWHRIQRSWPWRRALTIVTAWFLTMTPPPPPEAWRSLTATVPAISRLPTSSPSITCISLVVEPLTSSITSPSTFVCCRSLPCILPDDNSAPWTKSNNRPPPPQFVQPVKATGIVPHPALGGRRHQCPAIVFFDGHIKDDVSWHALRCVLWCLWLWELISYPESRSEYPKHITLRCHKHGDQVPNPMWLFGIWVAWNK